MIFFHSEAGQVIKFDQSWFDRLLTQLFKQRMIWGHCAGERGPLLQRWFLWRKLFGFSVMIHKFYRSDQDRHFHDHPWPFITFLFHSGYTEHTPRGTFHHSWGTLLYRPATWQHWVELTAFPTYTLVFKRMGQREWGFHTENGWIHWKQYDQHYERCD